MSSFLLSIGTAADKLLPDIVTALSCGAAESAGRLNIFSLSSSGENNTQTAELVSDIASCRRMLDDSVNCCLFPVDFSFQSCSPVFHSFHDLSENPDASLLISALRGKGLPLSCQTDREAVEWSFSDLLEQTQDESVSPFLAWLNTIRTELDQNHAVRLSCIADLTDPFAAGILLVMLQDFRNRFKNRPLSVFVIALAVSASPVPSGFFNGLKTMLEAVESRKLLRMNDTDPLRGADSAWLLSLPSSMMEFPDSFRILAVSAARVLGIIHGREELPSPGLHTRETDGTLSVSSLGNQAGSFASYMNLSVWLLADVIPSLRNFLSHPARLRSLALNPRTSLFRQFFSAAENKNLLPVLDQIEKTLKTVLSVCLRFLRSVPSALRFSSENVSLWQKSVDACGRYITVASEYDTSVAEARESGLDAVRPVHRVSLDDTEEEKLIRRLEDMKQQLEEEERARNETLSVLGGYRALQVRQDCLFRCRTALKEAEIKAASPDENADHLTRLKQERRVRLLKAAVERCESELFHDNIYTSVSAVPKSGLSGTDPYSGTPLIAESCHILEQLIAGEEFNSRVPLLFPDLPEPDPKTRWKQLQSSLKNFVTERPLPLMLAKAYELCTAELSSCSFISRSVMPGLPLLPDLIPDTPLLRIRDVISLLPDTCLPEYSVAEQRGVLAMLLLRQYRRRFPGEADISVTCCEPQASPLLRYWLSANLSEKVYIISFATEDNVYPFALILPGKAFLPARRTAAYRGLIPAFATWFNPENASFSDPCDYLGEGDRRLLLECLDAWLPALPEEMQPEFRVFLQNFRNDISRSRASFHEDRHLFTRLRAVCGLQTLPAYAPSLKKLPCFYEHFLGEDRIGSCITGISGFSASSCTDIPEEVLYLYRDIPFAREDSSLLLDSPHAAGEDYTLKRLASECEILSDSSDDYRDALVTGLHHLLARFPDILPEIRESANTLLADAEKPVIRKEPSIEWPWDSKSPSLLTVLRECLGDTLPQYALDPFSDLLAVFPARGGDVIGDAMLSAMCTVLPREKPAGNQEASVLQPDAVLPPLSPSFGHALCTLPEGRTLLRPGLLSFSPNEDGSFRVTLTLDGAFPVRLIRCYSPEEILHLYAHDIPTVAVWPSVPFPRDEWKAYFVYAHMTAPYALSVLPENGIFTEVPEISDKRLAAVLESFPVCFSLSRDGKTAGILPNLLPQPIRESSDPVEICVDFGSSGTSVVIASGGQRRPLHGPVMVRTLMNNPAASRDLLRREFIPAVPVSALLPTVSRLFRNVPGSSPVPFVDGIILMSSDLEDLLSTPSDAVYTSLKWEEEKGRSGFLCLHQVLLMSALQARCDGASSVSMRFSLPDEMAKEGRETLMNLFLSICGNVLLESGYSVPPDGLPVSFASESSALGAYFRYCSPDDTRGGFMVLDLGACTADISLFLRGREQAVRTCQIPLGIHYMLLPSLLRDPDLLTREFGFYPDETFRRNLSLLTRALHAARTDTTALRKARVALDYFISDHLSILISLALSLASGGTITRSGALLLLFFSYLLMLSGLVLLQLAADPNKNDFLPEQMSLCLAGRGSSLLEALPPPLKTSLWHFLSMFRNRRVASISLLFSSEKKMEIPVGLSMLQEVYHMLPPVSAVPASIAVRPAELLPEFLLRFHREFPAASELLFPGFYTNDYYHPFSALGESLISSSIDQSFPPADTPRPYDSLSAWIGNLLDLMP